MPPLIEISICALLLGLLSSINGLQLSGEFQFTWGAWVRMANMQIVPACKDVEPQYVEMKVPLYSYGCEKKIKKALANLRGIYSVSVDYKLQKVTVWGICNRHDVLGTIKNKRREAHFWDCEEPDQHPHPQKKVTTRSRSWKAWMLGKKANQ